MSPLAEVRVEVRDEVPVARVEGEVDISNAEEVAAALREAVPNSAAGLVVDLSATGHLDSSGLRLLYRLHRRLAERGQELSLVLPQQATIMQVVSITGLDDAMPVHETLEQALAAMAGSGTGVTSASRSSSATSPPGSGGSSSGTGSSPQPRGDSPS